MSSILLTEQSSAPATPAAGRVAVFVDTNGDLSWIADDGNVVKIAAAGAYTLTIPATGTAALSSAANTFGSLQTFAGGISLGNDTLSSYVSGSWNPTILGDSTAGTNVYTTRSGLYVRIGKLVVAEFYIKLTSVSSMVGNALLGGLPIAATRYSPGLIAYWSGLDVAYTAMFVYTVPGQTSAIMRCTTTAATAVSPVSVLAFKADSELVGTVIYTV